MSSSRREPHLNEGVLNLCLRSCNPLEPVCGLGEGCYPVREQMFCSVDASGDDRGFQGDPCQYLNVCNPGLFCAGADAVRGCTFTSGCCTPFCDLSAPNPAAVCGAGASCVPWYEDGEILPEGLEYVGACVSA